MYLSVKLDRYIAKVWLACWQHCCCKWQCKSNMRGSGKEILQVSECSFRFSNSCNCFIGQMAVPHLIIKWQKLMHIWNNKQWLSSWWLKERGHLYSQTFAHSIWWSNCGREYCRAIDKNGLKKLKQEEEKFMANHLQCLTASAGLLNHHITKDALCSTLSVSKGSVMAVTEKPDCSRICARLLPWILTGTRKGAMKTDALNLSADNSTVVRASCLGLPQGMCPGLAVFKPDSEWQWV